MQARCPDCGWAKDVDTAEDADYLLRVHHMIKLNTMLHGNG